MSAIRIGVVSPTEVAFPTVRAAFAELWPEADMVCQLDQSLYLDFINLFIMLMHLFGDRR